MSRFHEKQWTTRARHALALGLTVVSIGIGCGGDDGGGETEEDSGRPVDGGTGDDAARPDGGTNVPDGGQEEVDAGIPAVPGDDPPTLSRAGFYNDELGPRILLEGTDKNGDIANFTISFFKGNVPVGVEIDGDPDDTETSFVGTLEPVAGQAGFSYSFLPGLDLLMNVDTVKVVVSDAGRRTSKEETLKLAAAPTVGVGGQCDPRGFNRCAGGRQVAGVWTNTTNVCALQNNRHVCASIANARKAACANALVLDPGKNQLSVTGRIARQSLWDIPTQCSIDTVGQFDTVVRLHLDAPSNVVLSTDGPVTDFDTVIYKLPATSADACDTAPLSCNDQPEPCLCRDDIVVGQNIKTEMRLPGLPAGDHFFVVDRQPDAVVNGQPFNGVNFELKVTLQ